MMWIPIGVGHTGCWLRSKILVSSSSSNFWIMALEVGLRDMAIFGGFGEMAELIDGKYVFQLLQSHSKQGF